MSGNEFIEQLVSLIDRTALPAEVDVVRVRRLTNEENEQRLLRLINSVAEGAGENWRQRDIIYGRDRIMVRLPGPARAAANGLSGSMVVSRGLAPMEHLIGADDRDEVFRDPIRRIAERLELTQYIGGGEVLRFEKLWRIKAAAADPKGKVTDPVLCRAVGAFRHVVRDLPVWGAASAVVATAAQAELDKVQIHARLTMPGHVDRVRVIPPGEAATLVLRQLSGLMSGNGRQFADAATPTSFQFGYFALGKRTAQPYLAPAYIAMVEVQGNVEGEPDARLGHVAVVGGGEKDYLQFSRVGSEAQSDMRPHEG